jgi:hypothetical protein
MQKIDEIYICKAKASDGTTVYIAKHAGSSVSEVILSVMNKARQEGFEGSFEERLEELGWSVVRAKVTELA